MKKDGKVFCVIGDGMKNYLNWYVGVYRKYNDN